MENFNYGISHYILENYNCESETANILENVIMYFFNIYSNRDEIISCVQNCIGDYLDDEDLEKIIDFLNE